MKRMRREGGIKIYKTKAWAEKKFNEWVRMDEGASEDYKTYPKIRYDERVKRYIVTRML